ncbi:MAG TPA: formylglycine-generating enzyme family protein [Oscillatoriaceae cyanobacterium M33_DOE_052]|uniref:Formylglycine-generating enzyme family protein n=1 Tax=Planktothricoides sp. SpSt-374 TaxID=2282167 RepID=A0A7C3ZJQ1_9CYAN|nr:formylglycine-generating enzyme family protein [Oscillatoriaceae cyanobacterium M33_DOE_052]
MFFTFDAITINKQGKQISKVGKRAEYFRQDLETEVYLEMVAIPGGKFIMGSPNSEPKRWEAEGPQHEVTVPSFYLSKYPITQDQWEVVMGDNPSLFKGWNRPVEQVSWYDAVEFCQKLSEKTGYSYRLPSEAEWEYACRGGTTTPFYFGETIIPDLANYNSNYSYENGQTGEYLERTTYVGCFSPNPFGLYDMSGNVWEWCQDSWHENYENAPTDGSAWEIGGESDFRILRGGSWFSKPKGCRSAFRLWFDAQMKYPSFGFRVAAVSLPSE